MGSIGLLLGVLGAVVCLGSLIWLHVRGFEDGAFADPLLFLTGVSLISYTVTRWDRAKVPILVAVSGLAQLLAAVSVSDTLTVENEYKSNADKKTESAIHSGLSPARISEIVCCPMLGRAIVLVPEDQLAFALGENRQHERDATDSSGWNVEIMRVETLNNRIDHALNGFQAIPGVDEELAERLVGEGFLSFADLSLIHPDDLREMSGLSALQVGGILYEADNRASNEESNPNRGNPELQD